MIDIKDYKYLIVDRTRKNKNNLEGITTLKKDSKAVNRKIIVSKWWNWDTSLWIYIKDKDNSIILDSGVIEELAEEIKKIKEEQRS